MSEQREYSPEQKAAVMAALLAGQSVSQAAKEYRIPRGTVARWSAELDRPTETDRNIKKQRIGDLLLSYLETNLETLQAQMKVFRDEAWLKEQSASELAVLHGVIADKGIRLLEALQPDPDDGAAQAEAVGAAVDQGPD